MAQITKEEIKKILNDIMLIPNLSNEISKYNVSNKEIIMALPIFIEILNEQKNLHNLTYITWFKKTATGKIKKIYIMNNKKEHLIYKDFLVTQNEFPIDLKLSMKDLIKEKGRGDVLKAIQNLIQNFDNKEAKGFYLFGPAGVGKTYIMQLIANHFIREKKKVAFVVLSELVIKLKSMFSNAEKSNILIDIIKTSDLLILDDIGSETISEWFRDEVLLSILSFRMSSKLKTLFTSNYSIDQLLKIESRIANPKTYIKSDKGQRLIERIKALSIPILMTGINKRY